MNPLYDKLMGCLPAQQQAQVSEGLRFANPIQKVQNIMQAMQNPAAFVKQKLPQIPEQAYNDPSGYGVLQYMINNMGVTQQDIQNATNRIPK